MIFAQLDELFFQVRETVSGLRHARALGIATVASTATSLFVLGAFILLFEKATFLIDQLRGQYKLVLYLNSESDETGRYELETRLGADRDVQNYVFISRSDALESLLSDLGEKGWVLKTLETNPLPDAYEVELTAQARAKEFADRARHYPSVERISAGEEWVDRLQRFVWACRYVGLVLIVILGFASLLSIANTIWLTVYARRDEIHIMKQVGATNWFIRTPLILEGVLASLVGATLAVTVLWIGYSHVASQLGPQTADFLSLNPWSDCVRILPRLLFMGSLLGAVGSLISLRRIES